MTAYSQTVFFLNQGREIYFLQKKWNGTISNGHTWGKFRTGQFVPRVLQMVISSETVVYARFDSEAGSWVWEWGDSFVATIRGT